MSTRSRKSVETNKQPTKIKRVENSWLFLVQDKLYENGIFEIITLPHPASSEPAKYALSKDGIYEVMTYDEPNRSWFIGETVKSDASVQILTPINPLFLVLPKLKELCMHRAIPLEDMLLHKGYDKIVSTIKNLDNVADLKGPADVRAYKYNEEKTLNWLESRVHRLAKVLKEKNIHVTSGAASATFVSSNIEQNSVDNDFFIKYAHGIISEYLQDDLIELLQKKLNIKTEVIESLAKKRKSEAEDNVVDKKKSKLNSIDTEHKENSVNILSEFSFVKKPIQLTAKEKARQKAASGTKKISCFFKKN